MKKVFFIAKLFLRIVLRSILTVLNAWQILNFKHKIFFFLGPFIASLMTLFIIVSTADESIMSSLISGFASINFIVPIIFFLHHIVIFVKMKKLKVDIKSANKITKKRIRDSNISYTETFMVIKSYDMFIMMTSFILSIILKFNNIEFGESVVFLIITFISIHTVLLHATITRMASIIRYESYMDKLKSNCSSSYKFCKID